jgi:PLP dependent protein
VSLMTHDVQGAVRRITDRVAAAAQRSGRAPDAVRIVGAVKGVDVATIRGALSAGVTDLGENTAVQLRDKAAALHPDVTWHYLGAIQTNKVKLLDAVHLVHGLDRVEEAAALQARGERTGRAWNVLVEVNIAGERSKQGIEVASVESFLEQLVSYPLVEVRGFMFVAPQAQNPEDVRWTFAEGRRLGERFGMDELSMGMSDDFEVAIEEGATIVRIGRALFGSREPSPGPRGI